MASSAIISRELGFDRSARVCSRTKTALATLIFVDVWEWTPLVALILLAGLKALPNDLLEAAAVDGATPLRRLRSIILPLMLPTILLALTLRTVDAFRVFDSVFVTTGGGPGDATNTLMLLAVKEGLELLQHRSSLGDRQPDPALHRVDRHRIRRTDSRRRPEGLRPMNRRRLPRPRAARLSARRCWLLS